MHDATLAASFMAISLFACVGPAAIAAAVGRVPASNGKSRRSSVFDNVRFFLEVQVVFSHFVLFLHDKVPTGGSERARLAAGSTRRSLQLGSCVAAGRL